MTNTTYSESKPNFMSSVNFNPNRNQSRKKASQQIMNRSNYVNTNMSNDFKIGDIFGINVFNRQVMSTLLPKPVYKSLVQSLDRGERLDPSIADVVANAMKDWAISKGATHFCHWFLPMTGLSAEKHDSFLVSANDSGAIIEFSGQNLLLGEPDASSFPSGGIRSTFEARGYTGWDPTSPAFIMESVNGKTLCIPSIFCSFSGHALDKKTPLLRSMDALNRAALRLLNLLGNTAPSRIISTVGPEQEYFLIDEAYYLSRPDLINSGRALFGAKPPKGQEMEDHYWGSIKERVLAFMIDSEYELYKLGVPVKTRHNEVAPAQFEVAPVFETSNIACDHNMLLMEVFRKTAQKHGLRCLLHEKPFSGVNGSGKHNNWSLADDLGNNLLDPGSTPSENSQFLVMLTYVILAVSKYGNLLRASVASAGNDHRLGANEAPPAIMSIYLGDKLSQIIESLVSGKKEVKGNHGLPIEIGVSLLPNLPRHDSDRNRTSPFAFTGNKFEFRAVGSSQSIAFPNTVTNVIVAEAMKIIANDIEAHLKKGQDLNDSIATVLQKTLKEHQKIIFNGDNYSKEWHEEAAKRGLPNYKNTVESLPSLMAKESVELFSSHGVLTEAELNSRYIIMLENYIKTIAIEASLTANLAQTVILPPCLEYQARLAQTIATSKIAMPNIMQTAQEEILRELSSKINDFYRSIEVLETLIKSGGENHELLNEAQYYEQEVLAAMKEVRKFADQLELFVDDSLWPMPKFREMLYIY